MAIPTRRASEDGEGREGEEAARAQLVDRKAGALRLLTPHPPARRQLQNSAYMVSVLVVVALVGEQRRSLGCWWGWFQGLRQEGQLWSSGNPSS
jgi:hypothetical protein